MFRFRSTARSESKFGNGRRVLLGLDVPTVAAAWLVALGCVTEDGGLGDPTSEVATARQHTAATAEDPGQDPVVASLTTTPTAGWASATGWRSAETAVQRDIVSRASASVGVAPQSTSRGSVVTWQPDTSAGDGQRIRQAFADLDAWWRSTGVYLPLWIGGVPATVQATMRGRLGTYADATHDVRQDLVNRIVWGYNGSVPVDDEAVLLRLGARAQCKEFADRVVIASGGTPRTYASFRLAARDARPGMYAFKNSQTHTALIVDVEWTSDPAAAPVRYKVVESNWGGGWFNPVGQRPWVRTVGTRIVSASDYYVVAP